MASRTDKVSAALRDELSALITLRVKDPRVHGAGLLTVTGVRVTDDLRVATVLVSFVGGGDEAVAAALAGLVRAAGFLRGEAARRLALRRAPELRFVHDRSGEAAAHIDELIRGDSGGQGG